MTARPGLGRPAVTATAVSGPHGARPQRRNAAAIFRSSGAVAPAGRSARRPIDRVRRVAHGALSHLVAGAVRGCRRGQFRGDVTPARVPAGLVACHGDEPAGQAVRWLAGDAEQRVRHPVGEHGHGQRARAEPGTRPARTWPGRRAPRAPGHQPSRCRQDPARRAVLTAGHGEHLGQTGRGAVPGTALGPAPPGGQRPQPGHGGAGTGGQAQPCGKHPLGDGGEGHVDGHLEQRQPMPPAGHDQVIGDRAERGVPGGQRHGTGRGQRGDEGLGVGRGAAPHQAGQDDLAAGEVPARVEQVRGEHPVHRPVQGVLAHQHAQPQVRRLGQAPQ